MAKIKEEILEEIDIKEENDFQEEEQEAVFETVCCIKVEKEEIEELNVDPFASLIKQTSEGFVCPHCDYKNTSQLIIENHVRAVHEKSKDFRCPYSSCPAKFGWLAQVQRHIDTVHKKIKPFVCHQCEDSFIERRNLNKHLLKRHGIVNGNELKCQQCNETFVKTQDYTKHMKWLHISESIKKEPKKKKKKIVQQQPVKKTRLKTSHVIQDSFSVKNNDEKNNVLFCNQCQLPVKASDKYRAKKLLQDHMKSFHSDVIDFKQSELKETDINAEGPMLPLDLDSSHLLK